jgi:DNA-binding NarL/FixJ family response regulator
MRRLRRDARALGDALDVRAPMNANSAIAAPLRIFLVEDSAIIREQLIDALAGWADIEIVGHAETEAAATTALRTQDWDVLVLDLQLLQGSGLGLLQNLQNYRRPATSVIVLTNYVIAAYRNRATQLGADYFFDKASEFVRVRDALIEISKKRSGG